MTRFCYDFVLDFIEKNESNRYYDEAVCINLLDQTEKYKKFQNSIKGKNIIVKRFNAIDSRGEKYKKYAQFISPEGIYQLEETINNGFRKYDSDLSPGAIGCYLSHMNVYMYARAKNYSSILIFEDDVTIPTGFTHRFSDYIKEAPSDWDILLFGWINIGKTQIMNDKWQRVTAFWGLHAYMINQNGIKKLLKYGYPKINVQLDSLISNHSNDIKVYGVIPQSFIRQNDIHDNYIYATSIQIYPVKR